MLSPSIGYARVLGTITCITIAGCHSPSHNTELHQRNFPLMTTEVSITVAAPASARLTQALDATEAEMRRLSTSLSEWVADSEVGQLNARSGGDWQQASPDLWTVVTAAHEVSLATAGSFDITWAALHGLWDFHATEPRVPDPATIKARLPLIGFYNLQQDPEQQRLRLAKPGMKIGLGGIAKGYAVDRASAVLRARGFTNHLVVAGGDLYAAGSRAGEPWRVGVRAPNGRHLLATLDVHDEGVATSGSYERFFVIQGVRYHHILDPRTGYPAPGTSAVTVVAKSAMLADAYATGLFILGAERGLAVAGRHGLEALFLPDPNPSPTMTPGLHNRLTWLAPMGAQTPAGVTP